MSLNIEILRSYCLSKAHTEETLPFDEDTLAYKVAGKCFAFMSIKENDRIALKCDPERAVQLREEYSGIKPGYHLNKTHWNTVHYQDIPAQLCMELIDHSYALVVASLTKKLKTELGL
jgi:predicted DNA-binding protein (MmcQ/YjbR family)